MFPSTGGRRLVLLIRRTAGGGTNRSPPHAAILPYRCCSSAAPAATPDPDCASYLVASCGFSPDAAAAMASRAVRIRPDAKADAVVALLRRYGFSDADMVRMLPKAQNLLLLDPDKIIRPKLEFLATLGLRAAAVARTNLLKRSLRKHIVPCVKFLRGILRTDASIRAAVSRNPNALEVHLEKTGRLVVEALRRRGLSEEGISELLVIHIGVLRVAPNRIAGIFEDLELLGLTVTHSRFVRAFATMCDLKRETAWHRLSLYQSFGLSKSQVVKAFITQPCILGLADENIQRKLLFFQDELKIALSEVIARPSTLTLSMEKNILPKCSVLSVLMRSGKIGRDISLLGPLGYSTKVFSERYVKKFEKDVPDVVMAYEGKIEFKGFMDQDTEA